MFKNDVMCKLKWAIKTNLMSTRNGSNSYTSFLKAEVSSDNQAARTRTVASTTLPHWKMDINFQIKDLITVLGKFYMLFKWIFLLSWSVCCKLVSLLHAHSVFHITVIGWLNILCITIKYLSLNAAQTFWMALFSFHINNNKRTMMDL